MSKKTIPGQMKILTALFLMGMFAMFLLALWGMKGLADKTQKLYRHPYTVSNSLRDIKIGVLNIHRTMKDIALSRDQNEINRLSSIVDQSEKEVFASYKLVNSRFLGDKKKVKISRELFADWKSIRNQVIQLTLQAKYQAAGSITKGAGAKHIARLNTSLKGLLDFANSKGELFYQTSQKLNKKVISLFKIVGVLTLLIISFFSFQMIKNLKIQLGQVGGELVEQNKNVKNAGEQLRTIGSELLQSSQTQTEKLHVSIEAVTELDATSSSTQKQAQQASDISNSNRTLSKGGLEELSNLVAAIENISKGNIEVQNTVEESNKDMAEITTMILKISDKTQLINDIVFQAKLLSFNASVEAERAGIHGKGFAVVAEEIGNLAAHSGNAADEINQMLEKYSEIIRQLIARSAEKVQRNVEVSRERIANGKKTALSCQEKFNQVSGNASKVNQLVNQVSQSALEQNQAIKSLREGVYKIQSVNQINSSNSKKTSQTSIQLVEGQKRLDRVVGQLDSLIHSKKSA